MARWFPSGLSALSGQISNFTKEVLAEGIEEIDDHVTELRNARTRIRDLEVAASSQRAEMERLQQLNDELSVELQSHELQKMNLSDTFRAELTKKEEELKTLRQQQADYIDHIQHFSDHGAHQAALSSVLNAEGDVHREDFGDIISSQQEINRLRGDVRCLTTEVQHWRQIASDRQAGVLDKPGVDGTSNPALVAQLQAEIQELKQSMSNTVDEHQRQLSALHDVHRQTVAALKSSHSKSVDQLQKQLAALKSSAPDCSTAESTELSRLKEQLKDAETMRLKLEYDLEHTHAADNKKAKVVSELTEKLKKSEAECNKLAEQVHQVLAEKAQLVSSWQALSAEHVNVCSELEALRLQSAQVENQLRSSADAGLSSDSHTASATRCTNYEDFEHSADVSSHHADLVARNQQLEEQVCSLQNQVDSYKLELEQFELVKSDWQMEKHSLEGVLMKLRQEVKTRDEKLNAAHIGKVFLSPIKCSSPMKQSSGPVEIDNSQTLLNDDDECESHAGLEPADVEAAVMKQDVHATNHDLVCQLSAENKQLSEELANQSHLASSLELQLQESSGTVNKVKSEMEGLRVEMLDKSSHLEHLKNELDEKTTELNNLKSENCRLEDQLNTNSQLVKNLEEKQRMSAILLNEQKASVAAADEEKLWLEKVVCEYKEKSELLEAENRELEKRLDMLDAQHRDAVQQLIASRDELATNNLSLCLATQSDSSDKLGTDSSRTDICEPEPAAASSSDGNFLLSEIAGVSASDAVNHVQEEESVQLRCDLVASSVRTEQSDEELKACREQLQHLQLVMMEREKSYGDQIAQLSSELESHLSAKNARCSDCSSKECLIDELNVKTQSLEDEQQRLIGDLESCRREFEDEKRKHKVEVTQLHQQVEELTTKLQRVEEQPATYPVVDSQADEITATLRAEIEMLKESLDEKESVCRLYESEVQRLTEVDDRLTKKIERQQEVTSNFPQTVVNGPSNDFTDEVSTLRDHLSTREHELKERVEENSRLQQKVEEMSAELEQLQHKLLESAAASGSVCAFSNHEVHNGSRVSKVGSSAIVENSGKIGISERNSVTGHQSHSDSREVAQLCSTISQQKDMLDALNSKYASLRGLLEDRSQAQHGSSVLSDVHRLELELRDVRADRERLLTVLGEKTREASTLRAEVHRLTSVAAASQAALTKAQRDVQQIASQSQHETNQDMKNEAVKKLSQIIKDRDMEIGALQLKNATLVQVLQDSAPDGAKLAAVCSESDSLRSQLKTYQHDREQLIGALTAKHQESVGFYEEMQCLAAQVVELRNDVEHCTRERDSLSQQYEEKQQALFAALGDVASLRQRRSELESQLAATRVTLATPTSNNQLLTDTSSDTVSDRSSAEVQDFQIEIQRCRDQLAEKDVALQKREHCIGELEKSVKEVTAELETEQRKCCDVAARLRSSEELLSSRTAELLALKKQCESLTFELQSSGTRQSELIAERDLLRQRSESLGTDLQTLQATHSELTATVGRREFELNAFREQIASMQRLMETDEAAGSKDERQGEELKMLREQLEGLRQQAMSLQHERDQACLALQQLQSECTQLKNEIVRCSEKEQRLVKECDRLRGHLVQIEESYTREALEAEDREKQLRNKLAAVEEKVLTSSSAMQSAKLDSAKQLESLQLQLHVIAEQRDNALMQLSSAQETVSSYATSLSNLQMVLEQFQAERQQHQSLEIERYKRDWQHERDESDKLRHQLQQLQAELDEASAALSAAHRLSEQLDRKEAMISALRDEVHLRETELAKAEEQLKKVSSSTEAKIDKIIIKNLLLGYFHTPPSKRHEALQVIGQVLSYSRDEMKEITALNEHSEGSWLGALFRKKSGTVQSGASVAGNPYQSFSELFVKFLERESTPQPSPARLPAERMVQEQQQKQQHQRQPTPTFNPFSTSVLSPAPALTSAVPITDFAAKDPRANPLHPLMRPISPARVPIFAPASDRSSDTPPAVSGPDSTNSSGRSTPSAPSAILRDLLQQQ